MEGIPQPIASGSADITGSTPGDIEVPFALPGVPVTIGQSATRVLDTAILIHHEGGDTGAFASGEFPAHIRGRQELPGRVWPSSSVSIVMRNGASV